MKIVIEEHDAIFDCSWSESHENLLISGCGGGEAKMWDIATGKIVFEIHAHKGEIQSIECSHKA
jgi:hypothetical protein